MSKINSTTIIDVRSAAEFDLEHAEGAINIPLQDIANKVEEISKIEGEIILCCASGNRSGMAQQILEAKGITCHNAGSWFEAHNFAMAL